MNAARAIDGSDPGLKSGARETEVILRARARELARETGTDAEASTRMEVVEFLLAEERYAIEASWVREVYPLKDLTPLPGTPEFVLGIINVRGQIVSVNDVRKFFGLPERGLTQLNKVIILENAQMKLGILADVISGADAISVSDIQPVPITFTGVRADYLRGITSDRIAVLDGAKLLSDPRLVMQEEIENKNGAGL